MSFKINEFDQQVKKPKAMGDLMSKFSIGREVTKHEYEYQEMASDLETYYGKAIWALFHKKGFTEYKIKKAHEIAKKRGITKIGYLIGIIKKLP